MADARSRTALRQGQHDRIPAIRGNDATSASAPAGPGPRPDAGADLCPAGAGSRSVFERKPARDVIRGGAGSREENASKQKFRAWVLIGSASIRAQAPRFSCQSGPCPISGGTRFRALHGRCVWSAAIAQLVEHVIRNDGVTGSSPVCGTNAQNRFRSPEKWDEATFLRPTFVSGN